MESRKLVHLVRHAQAEHNVGGSLRREQRLDPGLTELGWQQVEELRKRRVDVQLVVVSPLRRTLQTAVGVFGDAPEESLSPLTLNGITSFQGISRTAEYPPFIATELCREFVVVFLHILLVLTECMLVNQGVHEANKRSPISKLRLQFPAVDFSLIKDEEDILWNPRTREPKEAVNARAAAFLQWLMDRKETNIAVVSHCGFLCTVLKMPEAEGRPTFITDKKLSSPFLNCELRTATLKAAPLLSNQGSCRTWNSRCGMPKPACARLSPSFPC